VIIITGSIVRIGKVFSIAADPPSLFLCVQTPTL
jgi:hypothetical protein